MPSKKKLAPVAVEGDSIDRQMEHFSDAKIRDIARGTLAQIGGHEARFNDQPIADNPYAKDSTAYKGWESGWKAMHTSITRDAMTHRIAAMVQAIEGLAECLNNAEPTDPEELDKLVAVAFNRLWRQARKNTALTESTVRYECAVKGLFASMYSFTNLRDGYKCILCHRPQGAHKEGCLEPQIAVALLALRATFEDGKEGWWDTKDIVLTRDHGDVEKELVE
jgi:hypothetical protein